MIRQPHGWRLAGYRAFRVLQVGRCEVGAALLALVSSRFVVAAVWTRTHHIPIRQEHLCLLVEELVLTLFDQYAGLVQREEEFLSGFVMKRERSARVVVETHPESEEGVTIRRMVPVHDLLRCGLLLACCDHDRDAMLVRAGEEQHITAPESLIPYVDVGRKVRAGEVTKVEGAVCVRKCGRDEGALEGLFQGRLSLRDKCAMQIDG